MKTERKQQQNKFEDCDEKGARRQTGTPASARSARCV
jgi:hypothetical protein